MILVGLSRFVPNPIFLINCCGYDNTRSFNTTSVNTVNLESKNSLDIAASGLETDSRWELVQRIISSQRFIKSSRLQGFLVYVCRCALENRQDEISEQKIGERVFHRPID